jgi:hypothetical protein
VAIERIGVRIRPTIGLKPGRVYSNRPNIPVGERHYSIEAEKMQRSYPRFNSNASQDKGESSQPQLCGPSLSAGQVGEE